MDKGIARRASPVWVLPLVQIVSLPEKKSAFFSVCAAKLSRFCCQAHAALAESGG